MDKPLWGLRVDGPSGRRFLRGLSLTRLWREGCGGRPYGRQYKCCLAALDCPTAQRGEGGAVRHQRGKSHRSWLIIVMLILPDDTESKSRNADFISIAHRAIRHLQRRRRCRPLSEAMQPFYTTRGGAAPPFFFIKLAAKPLPPPFEPFEPSEPYEPGPRSGPPRAHPS